MSETATRPRPRIESLSDMIFGLALSIGAIALVGTPPNTSSELYTDLYSFGFSFLILISVWMRYTQIMSVLPLEDRRVITLNTVLLFCVSIEPFLFNLLTVRNGAFTSGALADSASSLYALDLGAMMLILGLFTLLLADEEKNLVPKDMIKQFRIQGYMLFVSGALFFITILPIFWSTIVFGQPLRFFFWVAPLFLVWARRSYVRISKKRGAHNNE